jgi:hypothetical protein
MGRQLCHNRPPEWWAPDNDGARLALALCRACPNLTRCPDGDPEPHGVIRAAVAYGDAGRAIPVCPCGYPDTTYAGGTIARCGRCKVPDVAIPDPGTVRRLAVKLLARDGMPDKRIAAVLGVSRRTARGLRYQAGVRYRRGGQPQEVAA